MAELGISASGRQVDVVREGFDCVVWAGHLQDASLVARSLTEAPLYNVASSAYLKRYGYPQTPADLPHHRVIQFAPALNGSMVGFGYPHGEQYIAIPMPSGMVLNSTHMLLEACLAGFGILQAPLLGMRARLQAGRLWRYPTRTGAT